MKILPFNGDLNSMKAINAKFGLEYLGQDWDLINSKSDLVDDFIKYFLEINDKEYSLKIKKKWSE